MARSLKGVFSPCVTPFYNDGRMAYASLKKNIQKSAVSNLSGYLVLGSNGENKSLTTEEKIKVVRTVLEYRSPQQTVIAASIFESTRETIHFANRMAQAGVDYIALMPPCYFSTQMTDDVLIRYFTDVASNVSIPCLLYRAPQYSGGVDISQNVILSCLHHKNIIGLKDSASQGILDILRYVPSDFTVMSGSAGTFFQALIGGAAGGILSLANALPDFCGSIFDIFAAGDRARAESFNNVMLQLNAAISRPYGVAGVKYLMELCSYAGGDPRLPLLPLSDGARDQIRAAYNNATLF